MTSLAALAPEERHRLAALLGRRWAALAVADPEGPSPALSFVAFAPAPPLDALVLHLSELARHTGLLRRARAASLGLSEAEGGATDPQTLARLVLEGPVEELDREDPRHGAAREAYLARLPQAAPRFAFQDFHLFLLHPRRARYVGGFGRALALPAGELLALAGGPPAAPGERA